MRGRLIAGIVTPAVVLAGAGGYAWADAEDLVPGFITNDPIPPVPAPFLEAAVVAAGDPASGPVSLINDQAPLPDSTTVQALAQALRDDPRTGVSTNVLVVDLATGQTIASVDGDDPQVPASTTKVLTTAAALHAMGLDFAFETTVTFDPASSTVTLVAGGDMMLAPDAGHHGEKTAALGWAGVGDLADQTASALAAHGVTAVTVNFDDTDFPKPAIPEAWPAYVVPSGYGAPVTGLAVNIARQGEEVYSQRWPDPSAHAAETFALRLSERGIETRIGSRKDATGETVATVRSAPLSVIVEHTLYESDNTIAEQLARDLALHTGRPATPQGASAAILEQLAEMGVDIAGLEIYDGAGYSSRNRISPRHLVDTLRATLADGPLHQYLQWLPTGALEGTVSGRFHDTPAAGLLRAKTGSLTGVTSIAGVLQTADGRVLLFAVLADGMPAGQPRPRAAIDDFLTALAQCGC